MLRRSLATTVNNVRLAAFPSRAFGHQVDMVLLEDVERLGTVGDVVSVKAGYARNYLYPKRKAVYAIEENLAKYRIEKQPVDTDDQEDNRNEIRAKIRKKLSQYVVTLPRELPTLKNGEPVSENAVPEVNVLHMIQHLRKTFGFIIGKERIVFPGNKPITQRGRFTAKLYLGDDILVNNEEESTTTPVERVDENETNDEAENMDNITDDMSFEEEGKDENEIEIDDDENSTTPSTENSTKLKRTSTDFIKLRILVEK